MRKGDILDQVTKRGSTFLMIEQLLKLKDELVDIAHSYVCLSEAQWND